MPGVEKEISVYKIKSEKGKPIMEIEEDTQKTFIGKENKKLVPTQLGRKVNSYLVKHFPDLMKFSFTRDIESSMDEIASGEKKWLPVVKKFYEELEPKLQKLGEMKSVAKESERYLGTDSEDHKIYAFQSRHGAAIRKELDKKQSIYVDIPEDKLKTITLKEAIKLLKDAYPKTLGDYEGKTVELRKSKFGIYIAYDKKSYNVKDGKDPTLEEAINIIKEKEKDIIEKYFVTIDGKRIDLVVKNGKYGPYMQLKWGKTTKFISIPKELDPANLTDIEIIALIQQKPKKFTKKTSAKTPSKKAPSKKKTSKTKE